jgi:fido (protein-threonine AMPylation protein)
MQQLNPRQQKIIDFIHKNKSVGNAKIVEFLGNEISRFTVLRDLELLLGAGLIKKEGKGRSVKYLLATAGAINAFFDPELYFKKEADQRSIKTAFNPEVINEFPYLFSDEEAIELSKINEKYVKRIKEADESFIKKEIERLTIELSWKSSQIEGNTYTLIDTEILIKERIKAKGHKREEAIMILNHKSAIDYIFSHKDEFKKIGLYHVEKVHELLTRGLGFKESIRTHPVRIIGTRYAPPDGKTKIAGFLNFALDKINLLKNPFSRSLALILMISYIQPFADGNKRTARIIGNAALLASNACPLSYRSVDEADYKKATLLFYEQNSATFFKELFVEQFKFAVDNYF